MTLIYSLLAILYISLAVLVIFLLNQLQHLTSQNGSLGLVVANLQAQMTKMQKNGFRPIVLRPSINGQSNEQLIAEGKQSLADMITLGEEMDADKAVAQ